MDRRGREGIERVQGQKRREDEGRIWGDEKETDRFKDML